MRRQAQQDKNSSVAISHPLQGGTLFQAFNLRPNSATASAAVAPQPPDGPDEGEDRNGADESKTVLRTPAKQVAQSPVVPAKAPAKPFKDATPVRGDTAAPVRSVQLREFSSHQDILKHASHVPYIREHLRQLAEEGRAIDRLRRSMTLIAALSVVSILVMVVESEIYFDRAARPSWGLIGLNSLQSCLTLALLALLARHHSIDLDLARAARPAGARTDASVLSLGLCVDVAVAIWHVPPYVLELIFDSATCVGCAEANSLTLHGTYDMAVTHDGVNMLVLLRLIILYRCLTLRAQINSQVPTAIC